jgi:hypothetical protein
MPDAGRGSTERVRTGVATALALAGAMVLVHFVLRQWQGSMFVPAMLPWVRYAVALSLCLSILPLIWRGRGSATSRQAGVLSVFLLLGGLLSVLHDGATGIVATAHAITLALTSQELFGLAPATLLAALATRALLPPARTGRRDLRRGIAMLCLPGPIFQLIALASPGNERLIASGLLPLALLALVTLVLAGDRGQPTPRTVVLGTLVAIGLFYAPVIRGLATAGESAVLALGGFVALAALDPPMRRRLREEPWPGLIECGALVFALIAGVTLHHVVGLRIVVDGGYAAGAVLGAGLAAMLVWSWVTRGTDHRLLPFCGLLAPLVLAPALSLAFAGTHRLIDLTHPGSAAALPAPTVEIPARRWTEIPSVGAAPRRRTHSDAVFDAKRRQLVVLGSDTHGWDWDMAVYRFDLASREWLRSGTAEPEYTYRLDAEGVRIAGAAYRGPWAMHGYQQLAIDPTADALWIVAAPLHNHVPVTGPVHDVPWIFDLATARWRSQPFETPPPVFFPGVVVYEPDRDSFLATAALSDPGTTLGIGVEAKAPRGGAWELGPSRREWRAVGEQSPHGTSIAGVLDESQHALLVFERVDRGFLVHRFDRDGADSAPHWSTQPLPPSACTQRATYPPIPAVYVPHLAATLLLPRGADGRRRTCLYDAAANTLTDTGIEPPGDVTMNFTFTYDPAGHVIYLVTGDPYSGPMAKVWALRL